MKKLAFLSVMVMILVTFAGCKKGNVSIKTSEIDGNTMLIKADGVVQVATVEEFSESYYDLDELKEFIEENLEAFNQEVGSDTAVVLDSLEKRDNNAIMVLEYVNMEYYAQFNEVEASLHTTGNGVEEEQLPDIFTAADGESTATKSEIISLDDATIVILNEEYDLILSEDIKYYSNGTVSDSNEIQTSLEGTVVVY